MCPLTIAIGYTTETNILIALKTTLTIAFLLIGLRGFCQENDTIKYWREVCSSQDGAVKMFENQYKYFLKYKNLGKWDTLTFADGSASFDSCTIEKAQIDKKGLKEIIVSWTIEMSHSYGGTGGFYNKYTMHEIWSLDMRRKIFSAQDHHYNWENTYAEPDTATGMDFMSRTEICSYSYDFNVNNKGQVEIKNLKKDHSVTYDEENGQTVSKDESSENACPLTAPDHEEGVYVLKKGQFILKKDRSHHIKSDLE